MEKKLTAVSVLAITAFYALMIIGHRSICTEFCATYIQLLRMKGWGEVFHEFTNIGDYLRTAEDWYRYLQAHQLCALQSYRFP
jgi:hypothetical protein